MRAAAGRAALTLKAASDSVARLLPAVSSIHLARRAIGSRRSMRLSSTLDLEQERGAGFLLAPVLIGAGAVIYFTLPFEPSLLQLSPIVMLLAALWMIARTQRMARVVLAALALCVFGILAGKFETWRASTPMLGSEITTRLSGKVAMVERMANGRVRLTLDVVATERPKLRYSPKRVRASARKVPDGLAAGMVIKGAVRLMPPSGPVRPGGYDFSFESFFDGIGGNGFFLTNPEIVDDGRRGSVSFAARLENVRQVIAGRISNRIGGAEGAIAAALVVGVRAGIPEEVNEALRKTGIAHVLSISGLHMALVAATVMGSMRAFFACFPILSSRRSMKKASAACALAVLSLYLLASGTDVAAMRSYLMLAVILVAAIFDRAALTMRNVAIAGILILLWTPHEVLGPSFQMSFAATAALISGYGIWTQRRAMYPAPVRRDVTRIRRIADHVGHLAAGLAATSLIAGTATLLFAAYHFHRMSPFGLFTNLTAMPFVSVLVMPFSVLGVLLMPVGLDGPCWAVVGFGLHAMLVVAQWFADRSPPDAFGLVPPAALLAAILALIVVSVSTTWLRAVMIAFVVLGAVGTRLRNVPDVFVSEDGRLVAVRLPSGQLAVNRTRPNQFTLDNWKNASVSSGVSKPVMSDAVPSLPSEKAREQKGGQFHCGEGLCVITLADGRIIAHAETSAAAKQVCGKVELLVVEDATFDAACNGSGVSTTTITGRDLAQGGAASFWRRNTADGRPTVVQAISRPYRPWHEQRRYSRAARGLAPYTYKKRQPAGENP